jgi:hypothetical protein
MRRTSVRTLLAVGYRPAPGPMRALAARFSLSMRTMLLGPLVWPMGEAAGTRVGLTDTYERSGRRVRRGGGEGGTHREVARGKKRGGSEQFDCPVVLLCEFEISLRLEEKRQGQIRGRRGERERWHRCDGRNSLSGNGRQRKCGSEG